jgi:hypothetical protein
MTKVQVDYGGTCKLRGYDISSVDYRWTFSKAKPIYKSTRQHKLTRTNKDLLAASH